MASDPTGRLPYADSLSQEEKLRRFALKARAWGWKKAFAKLDKSSLLITDDEVATALRQEFGAFKCEVMVRAAAKNADLSAFENVYCLLLSGEWPLVRQLRAAHPEKGVISLTYDIMPLGALPDDCFPESAPDQAEDPKPMRKILVSLAGADTDYIRIVCAQNGRMRLAPTLGDTLFWWAAAAPGLSVPRVVKTYAFCHPDSVGCIQLDLLFLAQFGRPRILRLLRRWAEAAKVHLLYLNARDKCRIAVVQGLLADKAMTSFWSRSEKAVEEELADTVPGHLKGYLWDSVIVEAALEPWLIKFDEFKLVTLEEFVEVTEPVYAAVAHYFGFKGRQKIEAPDWARRYNKAGSFASHYTRLRNEMMAELDFQPAGGGEMPARKA